MKTRAIGLMMGLFLLSACQTTGQAVNTNQPDVATLTARAEHGDRRAQARLAMMCEKGEHGMMPDETRAVALYQQSAAQGLPEAQNRLAGYYLQGKGGLPQDPARALDLYLRAANQGFAWAQYKAGMMLAKGQGSSRVDYEAAYVWLTLATKAAKPVEAARAPLKAVTAHLTPTRIAALDTRVSLWKPTPEQRMAAPAVTPPPPMSSSMHQGHH